MVVMNVIRFPPTLHRITRYLFLTVEAKFKDYGVTVIRSFVFLRFICLAIIDPHRFGLMGKRDWRRGVKSTAPSVCAIICVCMEASYEATTDAKPTKRTSKAQICWRARTHTT